MSEFLQTVVDNWEVINLLLLNILAAFGIAKKPKKGGFDERQIY